MANDQRLKANDERQKLWQVFFIITPKKAKG